jgi:hypothetical protein
VLPYFLAGSCLLCYYHIIIVMEKPIFLDQAYLRQLNHVARNDPIARSAMETQFHGLMSGGISIKRKGSTQPIPDDVSMWDTWAYDAYFSCKVSGFAASQLQQDRVVVLDLTMLHVKYWKTADGKWRMWFYRQKTGSNILAQIIDHKPGGLDSHAMGGMEELKNVHVVYLDLPGMDGSINSTIARLLPEIAFEEHIRNCTYAANESRANPLLVTQKQEKINPNEIRLGSVTGRESSTSGGSRVRPYGMIGNGYEPHALETYSGAKRQRLHTLNRTTNDRAGEYTDPRDLQPEFEGDLIEGYRKVDLDIGQTVGRVDMPESPSVTLIQFREIRRRDVYAAFNIPLSMIDGNSGPSSSSSSSNSSSSSKSKSQGTSSAINIQTIFLDSQRVLQKRMCQFIQQLYHELFFSRDIADHVNSLPAAETLELPSQSEMQQTIDNLKVVVTIAAIPDYRVLTEIFEKGFLKYESFVSYISMQFNIPIDNFLPKPEITIKERNGIQPPAPSSSSSSSAKK